MDTIPLGLQPLEIGGGRVEVSREVIRLSIPPAARYADAQLDDHRHLPRARFPRRPGFSCQLTARASHPQPKGTLGFGLWNDPFAFSLGQGGAARRLPSSPRALWFFYASEPSDLPLSPSAPGQGWKASSLDSPEMPAWILAPLAASAAAMAQIPSLRGPVIRRALASVTASEALLPHRLDEEHEYSITWEEDGAAFHVDRELVLRAFSPPPGPLGFVVWIDNQFAVASPERGFRFGVIPTTEDQWLEVKELKILEEG